MTANQPTNQLTNRPSIPPSYLAPLLVFLITLALYIATAAPATLFGDPSEYQFIPAILGIAHPPGYAFYTLLAKLWQTLIPLGSIAYRTNLLAAAVGAWTVTAVYLTVCELRNTKHASHIIAPLFAALSLAASPDLWQHSIHANAHIVSVALAAAHLWLLVHWWRTKKDRYLAAFALTLGWAVTHHPITLMGIPAYGFFILVVRPRILRQWRTLLWLAGCLLLGLAPLLYYPLRSPSAPFGPTDMRTWEGFWRHATAQGLRVNLFHFGLPDQPDRALVLWSLLRLQFSLPVIILIVVGLIWIARRAPKPSILIYSFLLTHLLFTLNTVQDVMAYLLIPFAALAIAAGAGVLALTNLLTRSIRNPQLFIVHCSLFILLLPWPFIQAGLNLSRGISLRDFTAAEEYVAAVYDRFAGRGEGAVLLSDWEHLTPLWVHIYTQGESLSEGDVKLVYVNPANPWVESVWQHIEEGPIYVVGYRPSVRDAGFRLLPDGPFYQVVAPPASATPPHPFDVWADDRVHILGYDLSPHPGLPPRAREGTGGGVRAGESLVLTLYQSVLEPMEGIWMPYAQLGPVEARWTTDSRLLTPQWLPGEVVVERYELPLPFTLPPGEYPLKLGYADLSGGRAELGLSNGGNAAELATITVLPPPPLSSPLRGMKGEALANLDNQVALMGARARAGWQTRQAPWEEPLIVRAGRPLHLTLTWRALASPYESYTVFIHLIDGADRPVIGHDYTPLGGSCPTYLWFPKWLPGQTLNDPYRLIIPDDLPPGDYWLEVGMYGMTSLRRLLVVDLEGNLAGDRVILGAVRVE
ncbi:MAG: protein O-mannosyl-transferase family [Anaerolineae bacterium]